MTNGCLLLRNVRQHTTDICSIIRLLRDIDILPDIKGIALDWITGNLYGVFDFRRVFVCKLTYGASSLTCKALVSAEGQLDGIAVDPIDG